MSSLKKIGEMILVEERKHNLDLSVAFLKESKMQELNRIYRGEDKPTNVLAFSGENAKIPSGVEGYLGELVLCPAVIRKDAVKYGIMFKMELYRIFIHGLLHLLGYDHIKDADFTRMSRKEKEYLSLVS